MLAGKKGIIFGIANDHSIAWGIGKKLKEIEDFWVENSFKISDQELEKIVNN